MSAVRIPSLYTYVLGRELAAARTAAGVPIRELAARTRVPVCVVLDLEMGLAPLPAALVIAWCAALNIRAMDVMARVDNGASPGVFGLPIDLRPIAETRKDSDLPTDMTTWARKMLQANDSPQFFLPSVEITRLARRCHIRKNDLVSILRDFAPLPRDHVHE